MDQVLEMHIIILTTIFQQKSLCVSYLMLAYIKPISNIVR